MRQKLITLCPTSFELAGKKANFSSWVRRKLLEEQANRDAPTQTWTHYCDECEYPYPTYKESLLCRCRWVAKTDVKE